jgi:hypothetical protein
VTEPSSFASVLPAVVTGLAALGGVWITSWGTRKSAERQIAAEEKREEARIIRDDAEKAAADKQAKASRATASYKVVADLFLNEFSTVRAWGAAIPPHDDGGFEEWYGSQWSAQGEARLIRAIAELRNNERRRQISRVVEAISMFPDISRQVFGSRSWVVEKSTKVGFDLASTWARGQEPDAELLARYKDLTDDVDLVVELQESDREARQVAAKRPKRKPKSVTPPAAH